LEGILFLTRIKDFGIDFIEASQLERFIGEDGKMKVEYK
jgi:hypothetical protein